MPSSLSLLVPLSLFTPSYLYKMKALLRALAAKVSVWEVQSFTTHSADHKIIFLLLCISGDKRGEEGGDHKHKAEGQKKWRRGALIGD